MDHQGNTINNPDLMGKVMLDHLSQIIGKEDSPSPTVLEARVKVFEATKVSLDGTQAEYLEKPFSLDECWSS